MLIIIILLVFFEYLFHSGTRYRGKADISQNMVTRIFACPKWWTSGFLFVLYMLYASKFWFIYVYRIVLSDTSGFSKLVKKKFYPFIYESFSISMFT